MEQRKTYIDSNVIINAVGGNNIDFTQKALNVLEDPSRSIMLSDYVKIETLPKMRYNKQERQVEFTEALFANADDYVNSSSEIVSLSENLASTYGLSAMDAFHAASAITGGADELGQTPMATDTKFAIPA
jgi:predicted nucleic acid-binding protein